MASSTRTIKIKTEVVEICVEGAAVSFLGDEMVRN